jgi:hypothetical protein
MTLGELKKSLTRYPADMDDMNIVIQTGFDDGTQYDILCFLGYITIDGNEQIILGTWSAADKLIKEGKMDRPDDFPDYEG